MLDNVVFTPPTLLSTTPTLSAAAGLSLHASTGARQVTHAEGIFGTPAPRDVVRAAPGRDGTQSDTHWISERTIVLEGELTGASQRAVLDDWATLSSAFQSTMLAPGQLTVTLPAASGGSSRQQWCNVVLTSIAQVPADGGSAYLAYQVTFRADDPRWFGMTPNTSAAASLSSTPSTAATVANGGNAPTSPKFTFSGTALSTNVSVTVPSTYTTLSPQGSTIAIVPAVVAGFDVTSSSSIDCAKRSVSSLGSRKLNARTEWPVLYPGSSTWTWTNTSGTSVTCTMTWYDAWW